MNIQSNVSTPFSSLIRSSIRTTINTTTATTTQPATSNHDPNGTTPSTPTTTTSTTSSPPVSAYVILLQYSFSLHNRLLAAEPSSSSKSYQEHQQAGLIPPKEIANCDLVGGVSFVTLAMEECITLCGGRVVIVKCLDRYQQHDWDDAGGDGDGGDGDRSTSSFRDNGAVVDLASDPVGWDDDDDDDAVGKDDETKQQRRTVKARIDKLYSIFQAIQQAIEIVQTTCHHPILPPNATNHRKNHKTTTPPQEGRRHRPPPPNLQQRQQQQRQQSSQSSIPILFDSIAPILLHHGVPKFLLLLQQLKLNSDTHQNNTSPILLPVLTETITPFYMRQLEDASDAVLTVDGGVATIARRSARLGGMHSASLGCGGVRLLKEVQHFQISGGRDLVLVSSAFNTTNNDVEGGTSESRNLPKVTKRNSTNTTGGGSGGGNDIASRVGRLGLENSVSDTQPSGTTTNASSQGKNNGRRQLLLQHEDEKQQKITTSPAAPGSASQTEAARPKPRIYMEENDPEFDDLDEEDPDDDLDI